MKKSIIILSSEFPPQPGGIGNHAFNLAKSLTEQDFHITVISDCRSLEGLDEIEFDSQQPFKVIRIHRTKFRVLMYLKRLQILWNEIKLHECLIASGKFSLWAGALALVWCKIQSIAVIHGTEVNLRSSYQKQLVKWSLGFYDKIVAVSSYTKGLVSSKFQHKIVVIPNGFDQTRWRINKVDKNFTPEKLSLVTVGNVNYRKGQQHVISKLPQLKKIFPNLEYHIIGFPSKEKEFRLLAKSAKVLDKVKFHGVLNHNSMLQIINESDIFVMLSSPSKNGDVEGFGIAVLEANSQGLPGIGSLGCGLEDAIGDGISGKLVNHENSEDFISAISEILNSYSRYSEGALLWSQKHKWNKIVIQYVKLIQN